MTLKNFDPSAAALAGSGIFGLPFGPEEARVVLVPVPWDATTSYRRGTAAGPRAILAASHQVDLHDAQTGKPWAAGICMLPEPRSLRSLNAEGRRTAQPIIAAGGRLTRPALRRAAARVNELGDRVNAWVENTVEEWLSRGKLVGVVGGEHSVAFGAMKAVARRHAELGVLHVDAHADLRPAYENMEWSHASIFHNVLEHLPQVRRLVQVGIRDFGEVETEALSRAGDRVVLHSDAELAARRFEGETWAAQCARIVAPLPRDVYVSFDIDGLDPALCPNTGTPVPGGLSFAEATYLFHALVASGRRIVGFDLCEVAPGPKGDEWDANVGARILYKLIGFALLSQDAAASSPGASPD